MGDEPANISFRRFGKRWSHQFSVIPCTQVLWSRLQTFIFFANNIIETYNFKEVNYGKGDYWEFNDISNTLNVSGSRVLILCIICYRELALLMVFSPSHRRMAWFYIALTRALQISGKRGQHHNYMLNTDSDSPEIRRSFTAYTLCVLWQQGDICGIL